MYWMRAVPIPLLALPSLAAVKVQLVFESPCLADGDSLALFSPRKREALGAPAGADFFHFHSTCLDLFVELSREIACGLTRDLAMARAGAAGATMIR